MGGGVVVMSGEEERRTWVDEAPCQRRLRSCRQAAEILSRQWWHSQEEVAILGNANGRRGKDPVMPP